MDYKNQEEKISITGLLREIYKNKLILTYFVVAFLGVGLLVFVISPKEYTSSSVILPENPTSQSLGGIGSIASLAGFNIGKFGPSDRALSPLVYENIIRSAPFLDGLVSRKYYFPTIGKESTVSEYIIKHTTPTVFERIVGIGNVFKGNPSAASALKDTLKNAERVDSVEASIFSNTVFTPDNRLAIYKLRNRIFYETDLQTGLITISVDLQDPEVGAKLVQEIVARLIVISRRYSGQRDSTSIELLDQQILEKKKEYETAARRLASYTDQNRNMVFSTDKAALEQMQNTVALASGIYTSLLQQREQISIRSETEVDPISIIEPVQVATSPYKPKLLLTFIISIFLGVFFGSCFILARKSILTIIS